MNFGLKPFGDAVRWNIFGAYIGFVIILFFAVSILVPFAYAPLQDFPEWIFQAYVFNLLAQGASSDVFFLKDYPVPYAVAQILLSAMLLVFSPFHTSKVLLFFYFIVSLTVIKIFISRYHLNKTSAYLFLTSVVALNSCFWNGYIGYQIGLLIFLCYLCLPEEKKTSSFIILAFSILLFFAHGLCFVSFCVSAAIYSIYTRRVVSYIMSLTPSAVLVLWYVLENTTWDVMDQLPLNGVAEFVKYKFYTIMKAGAYHDFLINDVGDDQISKVLPALGLTANGFFAVFLIVSYIFMLRPDLLKRHLPSAENVSASILLVAMLALPPMAGGIVNPGERLLYPALVLFSRPLFHRDSTPGLIGKGLLASIFAAMLISMVGAAMLSTKFAIASSMNMKTDTVPEKSTGRILFAHRLFQFDEKMNETERSWQIGEMPNQKLSFNSSLVGERRR